MPTCPARLLALALFCGLLPLLAGAQPPATREDFQKEYEHRIGQSHLAGVYIPKDLGDAMAELNKRSSPAARQKFAAMPESEVFPKLFFGLGRWMIVNWSFYEGSRYAHYLRGIGIGHPEDMAEFTMLAYHRYLNKRELEVKALVEYLKAKQRARYLQDVEVDTIRRVRPH